MNISAAEVKRQLARLELTGFSRRLASAAETHKFPVSLLYGIASRETNCRNILGDGGHGVGIVQIDIRSHPLALRMRDDGTWETNPQPLIDLGAAELATDIRAAAARFPEFTREQHFKIAASAYNCGIGRAIEGAERGDSDFHTTPYHPDGKGDYGWDVMGRMAAFRALIGEVP